MYQNHMPGVLGDGVFEMFLCHENEALREGISALIKVPEKVPVFLLPREVTVRKAWSRKQVSPDIKSATAGFYPPAL